MTFDDWAARYPVAAGELVTLLAEIKAPATQTAPGSEAAAQQTVRMEVARRGGLIWRNNVGATPTKCPNCGAKKQPIRYGLANDSSKANKQFKSSDLIGLIPRQIAPHDVGRVIAQFVSIEVKRPGWVYTGVDQEPAQAAWLTLIKRFGGIASFSTGDVEL